MTLDKENVRFSTKKFYRRTAIITWMLCTTFLNAVEDRYRSTNTREAQATDKYQVPHRPFAPHVNVLSGSDVKVSWLPVLMSNKQHVRYELYSGDDAEYIGYDLVYVAKRLKPSKEYKFKVRACSVLACSEFSLARSCWTTQEALQYRNSSWPRPLFGKRRILIVLLPPLAVMIFFATLAIIIFSFWRLLCYYLKQYSSVPFVPGVQRKFSTAKDVKMIANMEMGEDLGPSANPYVQLRDAHPVELVEKEASQMPEEDETVTAKVSASREEDENSPRIRASSLPSKKASETMDVRKRSVSEGDRSLKVDDFTDSYEETELLPVSRDAVVIIDNSNVFIGAREAACAVNTKIRPKHVKVRLQGLAQVLEKGRKVTKRFAGGSSPPANEHVWDIYRRLGYTVDLEDRRGKDEQRVDEQLHLCIYKAIIDMPPQTLILASGDGSKGKSTGATSFPDCVLAAMEHGWNVEVHSWKHSLSAEWLRIAAKHKHNFKIHYLDENLHKITSVEFRCKSRDRLEDNSKNQNENRVRA